MSPSNAENPGFRVAAFGLARNDGRVVFVIPAKARIQGRGEEEGILVLSNGAKQSLSLGDGFVANAPRNNLSPPCH
jgi:hypothetical protein